MSNEAPGSPNRPTIAPQGRVVQRAGGAVFDYREAFWAQWDRCLERMTQGLGLTGAIEALYATARLAGDVEFLRQWEDRPIHGNKDSNGEWVLIPTLQDNLRAFEIIGDLAKRKGWSEKKRLISELQPWKVESGNGMRASEVSSSNGENGRSEP